MIRVALASSGRTDVPPLGDGDSGARSFTFPVGRSRFWRFRRLPHRRRPMVDPTEILAGWAEFTLTPPSEYFLNCLRSVGEATAGNGAPAYQPDTISQLITTIAGRGYGPLLFRSVHVMSAAAVQNMQLDQLLVTTHPLTARHASRLLFAAASDCPPTLARRDGILEFREPGSDVTVFKLTGGQVPLAVACLEFLVEALGFDCLHTAFSDLTADHGSARRKAVTKDLSTRLYNFLGEHLPQMAERNMARLLAEHLATKVGAPQFTAEDIDDGLILDFWIENSGDDSLSFRLFGTAAKAWMTFRDSLIHSQGDAFDVHLSLTASFEDEDLDRLSQLAIIRAPDAEDDDGTTSPDLGQLVGDAETPTSWISDLQRPPCSAIKFLTKTELTQLSVPALAGAAGHGLVLTCLRLATFGPLQNRLVQANRGGDVGKDDIELEIASISDAVYEDHLADWRALRTTVENIATTAFLRLWDARNPAIFEYLSRCGDDGTRREMAAIATDLQDRMTPMDADDDPVGKLALMVLDRIDTLPSDSPLGKQRKHMKRVAQSYRRQGLRAADIVMESAPHGEQASGPTLSQADPDHLHALICGGDRLLKLAGFLASMDQLDQPIRSHVLDDIAIFSHHLSNLHETTS